MQFIRIATTSLIAIAICGGPALAKPANCPAFNVKGDRPLDAVTIPPTGLCKVRTKAGFQFPDPTCTPGAVNPALTNTILKNKNFRTGCERDQATSATKKKLTYDWYAITKPADNREPHMICELDHLISIELGGADTLDNIWPQCGPDGATGEDRSFKQKDLVENYLAAQIRAGKMNKTDVQKGIAQDWTQYLDRSRAYYATHKKRSDGG
jgi:hypothetical protein